jgi:hypothetical protein
MPQKWTRTLMFAEEMVRACLPYADKRRVAHHTIEMIEVIENTGEKIDRKVRLLVTLKGRDRLIATCLYGTYFDTDWIGDCFLETEEKQGRVGFRCSARGGGNRVSVTPMAGGPGTRFINLSQEEVQTYLTKIPLLRNRMHDWDIWRTGETNESGDRLYEAWRASWILDEPFAGTMDEIARQIIEYELGHRELKKESIFREKWEEALARLTAVAA